MLENLRAIVLDNEWERRTLQLLTFMQLHGQSVLLGWGEDDGLWECSWITSGERFTSLSKRHSDAVELTARKVITRLTAD